VYDFEDYCGEQDHRQVFVTKVMATNSGQCHSLPLLYKIMADEMKAEAFISHAPSHSYIQHRDQQGNWYNLELTNGCYVTEASIMNFGYIKAAALKNKVFMDTFSLKQTIGSCIIDLALGYDAKFGSLGNDDFILQCCQLVLANQPNHVQAMMVQANVLERQLARLIHQKQGPSPEMLFKDPQANALNQKRIQLYQQIDALGYAQMPKKQYETWLASLSQEKQKQSLRGQPVTKKP
jgi:hypothetical protein